MEAGTLELQAPAASVAEWPVVGERVYTAWNKASTDLPDFLHDNEMQVKALSKKLLAAALNGAKAMMLLFGAFVIAGIMMAFGQSGIQALYSVFARFVGEAGEALVVDEVGSDFHAHGADDIFGLFRGVLIGRHDAVVHVAVVGLLGGEDRRRNFRVATAEPGENTVVEGGGDAEETIEAVVQGPGTQGCTPVGALALPQPQVPFADAGRAVALPAEQVRQGQALGIDQVGRVAVEDPRGQLGAPRVAPRKQTVARGCTNGRRRMGIGEAHTLSSKRI